MKLHAEQVSTEDIFPMVILLLFKFIGICLQLVPMSTDIHHVLCNCFGLTYEMCSTGGSSMYVYCILWFVIV